MKLFILLLCFIAYINYSNTQECPQPNVHKRTIIRSATSIQNGASLLRKLTVSSARECYEECCSSQSCNVAVMHYKDEYTEDGEEIMGKYCFLFDCKTPSVCSYDQHSRYAIIEIPKPVAPVTKKPTFPTTVAATKAHEEEKCPPGVPVAMCSEDPCKIHSCESHKDAICKQSYCGGCFAKFYDQSGNLLQCKEPTTNNKKNEEIVVVASTDYEETPVDSLPVPAEMKANEPTEDLYYQSDRRKWVDGTETGRLINASLPKTTKAPAKIPTTVSAAPNQKEKVIFVNNSFMSIPLLIALCICILLILGLIYRFKCAGKGKPKKFPVDDGDYLINGMYL